MKRILIIDDDVDILDALSMVLEDDYEVVGSSGGSDALRLLQKKHFDAVVVDLMMPEMDGESLVDAMRQIGIKAPVLLASAVPDLHHRAVRLNVPCISKPYDIHKLEAKLAAIVGTGGGAPGAPARGSRPGSASDPPPNAGGSQAGKRQPAFLPATCLY